MKTTFKKEIILFAVLLSICSALFWSFSAAVGKPSSMGQYLEGMIVAMLVCYLFRFVFIVMKHV